MSIFTSLARYLYIILYITIVAKAGNPGTQRTNLFKESPTKKATPTRYFTEVETFLNFFVLVMSLARSLQYIHVKGLIKGVCREPVFRSLCDIVYIR